MRQSIANYGHGFIGRNFLEKYKNYFSKIITSSKLSSKPHYSIKHLNFDLYKTIPQLEETDIAIISIPFSRLMKTPLNYYESIKKLCLNLNKSTKVIFTSSTSVYELNNNTVNEKSQIANNSRAVALNKTEKFIISYFEKSFILRLGGICGLERNSKNKLSQDVIKYSNSPVNLIHINDIILFIMTLIESSYETDIINLCTSAHPTKKEYYTYLCNLFNLPHPLFDESLTQYKIVSNNYLKTYYKFTPTLDSPLKFTF